MGDVAAESIDLLDICLTDNPGVLEEVFARQESGYCLTKRRYHEHLAPRFAAKEAVLEGGTRWRSW